MSSVFRGSKSVSARVGVRKRTRIVWWIDALWSAGAGLGAAALAWWALRLTPTMLGQRWTTGGDDGLLHELLFSVAAKHFSYDDASQVGFPAGLNVFFSGQVDPSSAVVLAVLGAVFRRGPLMLSVFVLLGFFSSAVTATWFGRALRVSRPVSVGLGIAFALAPFHFQRIFYGHYFVANTWAIPLIGVVVLMVLGGSLDPFAAWRRSATGRSRVVRSVLPAALLAIGIGSTGSYFAAFGVIVVGGAWIVRVAATLVLRRRPFRDLIRPTLTTAGVGVAVGTAIVLLGLGYGVRSAPYFSDRLVGESELYAGKLTTFLFPWSGSDIPGTARLLGKYARETRILQTTEAPGTPILAAVGAVLAILALCAAATAVGRRVPVRGVFRALLDPRIVRVAPVMLWTFMFFTVSGLGFVFALFLGPEIRAWTRISIVLILFGLGVVAVLVDLVPGRFWCRAAVGAALTVVVLVDQVIGVHHAGQVGAVNDRVLRSFVTRTAAALPSHCGIVQLPLKSFPDSGGVGAMGDYDEAMPFVADPDRDLMWSYGAIRGTLSWDKHWKTAAASNDPRVFARAVRNSGACAVEVDLNAYRVTAVDGTITVSDQWRRLVAAVGDPAHPVSSTADGRLKVFRVTH